MANGSHAEWRERAACRGITDLSKFFNRGAIDPAIQRLCMGCPVRRDCLAEALERKEHHGIWGGTTGSARIAITRGRSRKTCPACASERVTEPGVIGPAQICLSCALTWPVRASAPKAERAAAA